MKVTSTESGATNMEQSHSGYQTLKWKHIVGLAAPHTWPASVLPALLGITLGVTLTGRWDFTISACLLVIAIMMQCAVNTFNDYADFIKNTDTLENSDDPSDAILVYNKLRPKTIRMLGCSFLLIAALAGVWVTVQSGFIPLIIGAIGGATVLLYSFGKLPISYMPLGELVSGFVMGGLIPLASYAALASRLDFTVLLYSLPLIISIALIMNVNNISDIERDIPAGKKTLPVLLGRKKARILCAAFQIVHIIVIGCMVSIFFTRGLIVLIPVFALAIYLTVKQIRLPLTHQTRGPAMSGILHLVLLLGLGYIAAIILHGVLSRG